MSALIVCRQLHLLYVVLPPTALSWLVSQSLPYLGVVGSQGHDDVKVSILETTEGAGWLSAGGAAEPQVSSCNTTRVTFIHSQFSAASGVDGAEAMDPTMAPKVQLEFFQTCYIQNYTMACDYPAGMTCIDLYSCTTSTCKLLQQYQMSCTCQMLPPVNIKLEAATLTK